MFTAFQETEAVQHAAADTLHAMSDTLHAGAAQVAEHGEPFNFSHLLDHIKDSHEVELPFIHLRLPEFPPVHIAGLAIDLSPTKHVFFLVVSAVLLAVLVIISARAYRKSLVPHGLSALTEMLLVFVRDEIALPSLGAAGVRYVPYLLTTFFYILIMNLIGLIPFAATPTANVMVTAGLAIVAFIMIQASAIRAKGFGHYLAHLTGGVHWALWIIMIPIEVLGLFTKPFALCVRLFANMNAGHIVVLSLIGLIFMFRSLAVTPISIPLALFIDLLELLVAVIQAYVFTMLTALFMGLGMEGAHDEEEHAH